MKSKTQKQPFQAKHHPLPLLPRTYSWNGLWIEGKNKIPP